MYGLMEQALRDADAHSMDEFHREERRTKHVEHVARVLKILMADGGITHTSAIYSWSASGGKTATVAEELAAWAYDPSHDDDRANLRIGLALLSAPVREQYIDDFITAYANAHADKFRAEWA